MYTHEEAKGLRFMPVTCTFRPGSSIPDCHRTDFEFEKCTAHTRRTYQYKCRRRGIGNLAPRTQTYAALGRSVVVQTPALAGPGSAVRFRSVPGSTICCKPVPDSAVWYQEVQYPVGQCRTGHRKCIGT
eukprot:2898370-Rhodomonas_salina.3